jgi:hypothetical protein
MLIASAERWDRTASVVHGSAGSLWRTGARLCVSNLVARRYLSTGPEWTFVLNLDTDALVIAPFADKIAAAFSRHERAGLLGTIAKH